MVEVIEDGPDGKVRPAAGLDKPGVAIESEPVEISPMLKNAENETVGMATITVPRLALPMRGSVIVVGTKPL